MAGAQISLRIAVIQFAPKIGQVQANITKARELCAKLQPRSVDLVCLPEMIFTGYMFPNARAIRPYLEQPQQGPTSLFCAELASRLRCYVTAGYPEQLSPEEVEEPTTVDGLEVERIGANSAVLYGPDGHWVGGYRKTNLFKTDLTWAKAGTGFVTLSLPSPLSTVSLAICNDLNVSGPVPWTLEQGPYEVADYCISKKTNLLILLDAWLDSGTDVEDDYDLGNVNYWVARLRPLWINPEVDGGFSEEDSEDASEPEGERTLVVVCNRFGEENGETFAGTSTLLRMRRGSGRPEMLNAMGRREEGVRIWTV